MGADRPDSAHLLTRRDFCAVAGGAGMLALPLAAGSAARGDYHSALVNGLAPQVVEWEGRRWRCNMGSTWQPGMNHCLLLAPRAARFEIRNSPRDHSRADEPHKRRSELSGKVPGAPALLPNGVALWSAMSFIHQPWDDPAGMRKLTGGVHGQIHMGHGLGGSPAVAFRRTADGQFRVTTRGQYEPEGKRHFTAPLAFGTAHNLVYRVVLHPTAGALTVWLDGTKIVDVGRASIGSEYGDSVWNIGCYYAGGVTCPVVAEFANAVYPGTAPLGRRIAAPPAWPR